MSTFDEVEIRCHCNKLHETVVLANTLPYERVMCHCNTCRYVTGALTFTGMPLLNGPGEIFKMKLIKYATSETCWRYFCGTCGSHAVYFEPLTGVWSLCTGAIEEVKYGKKDSLERIIGHKFMSDTLDGGLSWCLPAGNRYLMNDDQQPVEDLKKSLSHLSIQPAQSNQSTRLSAQCHCGQVCLTIERPDNGGKWKGCVCVCRSCRLSFGQTFVSYLTNLPFNKLTWQDGRAFDDTPHQSITRFQSSDHAHRDFCGRCGASVLWSSDKEPGTVDIAAGLLRGEGALAQSWLDWDTTPFLYKSDAVDTDLVCEFEKNLSMLSVIR